LTWLKPFGKVTFNAGSHCDPAKTNMRIMSEYKEIPIIPIELSIETLEQFYRAVGILNRVCGKNRWKGPKGIVKRLRKFQDYHEDRYPLKVKFWIFDGNQKEVNVLIKLSF